jgi:hypothetical protein
MIDMYWRSPFVVMPASSSLSIRKTSPCSALSSFGIEAQHPDEFVGNLFSLDPAAVVAAAQRQRQQLKMPPMNVSTYLDLLLRQGLVQSSKALTHYCAIL